MTRQPPETPAPAALPAHAAPPQPGRVTGPDGAAKEASQMTSWSGDETPAGAGRDTARATPAGTTGHDQVAAWKAALAAHRAALRRGARRPRRGQHRAGMIRIMPPGPPGGDNAA